MYLFKLYILSRDNPSMGQRSSSTAVSSVSLTEAVYAAIRARMPLQRVIPYFEQATARIRQELGKLDVRMRRLPRNNPLGPQLQQRQTMLRIELSNLHQAVSNYKYQFRAGATQEFDI